LPVSRFVHAQKGHCWSLAAGGVLLWVIARVNSNSGDTYQKSDPFSAFNFVFDLGPLSAGSSPMSPHIQFVASPQSVLRIQGSIHLRASSEVKGRLRTLAQSE